MIQTKPTRHPFPTPVLFFDSGQNRSCLLQENGSLTNGTHLDTFLTMGRFDWSEEKNEILDRTRKVCFEDVVVCIQNGGVLDVVRHPNRERYPKQNMIILNMDGYVWLVPYVKEKGTRFLKTIIPSRKATKEYLP